MSCRYALVARCLCLQLDWPIFFSTAEATSIDTDGFRGDGLHNWVGSSTECVDAWHKFSCAYTYDRCDPADGSVVRGKDAPSCRSGCEHVVRGQHSVASCDAHTLWHSGSVA